MTPGQAAFIGYMDVMSGPNPIGHGYPASEKVMEAWEAAAIAARADLVAAPDAIAPPTIGVEVTQDGANSVDWAATNVVTPHFVDMEIQFRERCELADSGEMDPRPHEFRVFATKAISGFGQHTEPEDIPPPEQHAVVRVTGFGADWMCVRAECGRYCLRLWFVHVPSSMERRMLAVTRLP